ncbi:MAG: hypothetical protein E7599_01350 [Ruminococcaceae bacterium]|nr:hypothetical protein [Oscillospiraceae bacterium]
MDFKDAVIELNEQNYSYTNEILYEICKKSPTILDKNTLASKIEIIGRVYAASPERRSYNRIRFKGIININKSKEEYEIDPDHHSSLKSSSDATSFPSWIIKPLGDGQGSFFTELAEQLRITEDFKESYSYCENHSFKFDLSNDDIDLLKHVIRSVLLFNQMIKAATMKVDGAPETITLKMIDKPEKIFPVQVRNQISFCSKFLHFHLPNHIFIIDSYSNKGGALLFSDKNKPAFLSKAKINGWDLLAPFSSAASSKIKNAIDQKRINFYTIAQNTDNQSNNGSEHAGTNNDKDFLGKEYANHALRAYLLCCICKNVPIEPKAQIQSTSDIKSYPRLADCILMNIKDTDKQQNSKDYDRKEAYEMLKAGQSL